LLVLVLACWCPWAVEAFAAQLQHSLAAAHHGASSVVRLACTCTLRVAGFCTAVPQQPHEPRGPPRHACCWSEQHTHRTTAFPSTSFVDRLPGFPYVCACVLFAESSALQQGWMRLAPDLLSCHGSCMSRLLVSFDRESAMLVSWWVISTLCGGSGTSVHSCLFSECVRVVCCECVCLAACCASVCICL